MGHFNQSKLQFFFTTEGTEKHGAMQVASWFDEPRKIPRFAEPLPVGLRLLSLTEFMEGDAAP